MCDQAAPVTASSYLKILENSLSIRFHSFFHIFIIIFFLVVGIEPNVLSTPD